MKKFILVLIVLSGFLVAKDTSAIDTLSIKYFPMHIGDFWVYDYFRSTDIESIHEIRRMNVISTVNLNNHIYYIITGYPYNDTLRADSVSGSIRKYNMNNDCVYYYKEKLNDSLAALVFDSVKNCSPNYGYRCTGIQLISIFGFNLLKKGFEFSYSNGGGSISFIQEIGINHFSSYFHGGGHAGGQTADLKGCRINGIVYGDTSMTNINEISTEIPEKYNLSQNYPNPFNPITNIKYQIKNNIFVTIKIFDILGKEIATLVSEKQSPGTYEINWDASLFPSGIYFYRLICHGQGEFSETKRMLLVK